MVFHAGVLEPICLSSPTKLWHFGGWVVWSTTCTCNFRFLNFKFDRHGKRPSLEPQSWNLYFTVGAIWTTLVGSIIHDRRFIADILVVTTSPNSSPTTTSLVFNGFILFYSILFYSFWWQFRTWWSLRRSSVIRRMHRRLICFPSNLHVTGFSSCRITSMIHSYLVWFLWWLRHGAIGPIEATPVGVNVDWPEFRIYIFELVIRLRKV